MSTTTPANWLDDVRARSALAFADTPAPTKEDEVWRYSRIDSVDLNAYQLGEGPVDGPENVGVEGSAATVVIRNGEIDSIETGPGLGKATVTNLGEHSDGEALLNGVRGDAIDAVGHLHDANLRDVVVIDVPRGAHVEGPVVIDVYADAKNGLTSPHTIVRAGAGSSVSVLERRRSGEADQLVLPVIELDAAADARIGYLVIQELGASTTSLEHITCTAGQQANVTAGLAAFGGSYARTRADLVLAGRGASGDLLSAYFADGDQMLDFRTFQDHQAPDTTSNLLFKGAVTGASKSVYSGLILVADSAPGTNAFQTNRNLKLSDDAWAYSVPNLEIEQNEVACSHASTVGEIDEEQLYYLESRGVPPTMAEQLLVSGFFAEVIEKMPIDAVKIELQSTIDAALNADRDRKANDR